MESQRKPFHCKLLFTNLIFILILYPFLLHGIGRIFLHFAFLAMIFTTVHALASNHRLKFGAMIIGVPWFLLTTASIGLEFSSPAFSSYVPVLECLGSFISIAFMAYAVLLLLQYIITATEVTDDVLFAAASVYILLGIAWSIGFALLEYFQPGSFQISDALLNQYAVREWPLFAYYSFVTLTTVGYGDMTPISPLSQSMAILEALTGVFYMALIIARLVSMYQPKK
ncbi:hypothetical protein K8I31_04705 [bacterium]|nr:hypothetical protein [bacterium]